MISAEDLTNIIGWIVTAIVLMIVIAQIGDGDHA